MDTTTPSARSWLRRLALVPAIGLWLASAAIAQSPVQDIDPPGRVATLTQQAGSVVFAPEGEDEWVELPPNRPLTRGDRVWTDRGSRAELHMGTTTVHLDGETNLAFFELDDDESQLSLTQGALNLRVRDLQPRENVEVDTPNLAVRATRVGDYRIDVDTQDGTTRVQVRSGEALVFGQGGESVRLAAGQQAIFEGRDLREVRGRFGGADDFDRWASDLNRREDQSASARYIPRGVIGYQELDNHGTWDTDTSYGPVWYPRVVASDWAPYRYGRWTYIRPWGWTWVDEAPWGFAPFHYGRWALIGSRWAWVPGRFGPRPIYSPALVAFVGGGSGVSLSFSIGSGPGIGWYPLAPGEAWYPTYRTTNIYITNINRNIALRRDPRYVHVYRNRADAWTSMRVEDFNHGRRVVGNWRPVRPADISRVQVTTQLPRPEREDRGGRDRAPRLLAPPPAVTTQVPSRTFGGTTRDERRDTRPGERRDARDERKDDRRDTRQDRQDRQEGRRDAREERRDDRPAERAIPGEEPRRPNTRPEDERRAEDARRQHQEQLREQQSRREQDARQQQQRANEEQARRQREQAQRQQQEQQRAQREQVQRDQAERQQQERAAREQAQEQQRAQREQERAQRQQAVQQQRAQREQAQQQQERSQRQQQQQQERAERQQQQQQERAERQQQRQQRDDDNDERRGRGRGG